MLPTCKFLFFFFCFSITKYVLGASSAKGIDQVYGILRGLAVDVTDKDYIKKVSLTRVEGNIISVSQNVLIDNYSEWKDVGKSNALYSFLTCNIGQWTVIRAEDFLRSFSALHKVANTKRDNDAFAKHYDTLNEIEERITEFITVTYHVLDINRIFLYHVDTSILTSLVSLRIKCDLLASRTMLDANGSDAIIIREMLREIHTIRSFLLMNCGALNLADKRQSAEELELFTEAINKNVDVLGKMIRMDFGKKCTLQQVLLANFKTASSLDPVSTDVLNAYVRIVHGKWVTVREILEKIPQSSYDAELMYWYGKSIIPAVMKLIFCKLMTLVQDKDLTMIPTTVRDINSTITDHPESFPPYFVECFKFFATEISRLLDSNIEFGEYNALYSLANQRYHSMYDVDVKCDRKTANDTLEELENLLGKIAEHVDDLGCFNETFKYLHVEFDKTHNSRSAKQVERKLDSAYWSSGSDNLCKFVSDMYGSCHETVLGLDGEEGVDDRAWKSVDLVKHYFLAVIKVGVDDLDLFETAVDAAIVLVNQNKHAAHSAERLKRTLYYVMARIEKYGSQHCAPPVFDYFSLGRVNFDPSSCCNDDPRVPATGRDKYFPDHDSAALIAGPRDEECFSATFLYRKFVRESEFFALYTDTIRINWRGKEESVQNVFRDASDSYSSPRHLRVLYDLYFKYYIAVIYHELKMVYNSWKNSDAPTRPNKSALPKSLDWYAHFPDQFGFLIEDVNSLALDLECIAECDSSERMARIEKQIEIFIISNMYIADLLQNVYAAFYTKIKQFIGEVSRTVSAVNACYAKITRLKSDNPKPERHSKPFRQITKIFGKGSK